MSFILNRFNLSVLTLVTSPWLFAEQQSTSEHSISGNIGVISEYILRGNTAAPENDNATIQGGLDYQHASGFYLGYWGSTLGYSLTNWNDTEQKFTGSKAFEHDFYTGYKGTITEDLGYTVGATYYYYYQSDVKSNTWETLIGLNYKNFAFNTQTLLGDVTWGNKGDTYLVASYNHALPKDFSLNALLGAYYYRDKGDFESALNTQKKFAFRHVTLGLSHPLGDTGATVSMDYIIGGKLRDDTSLKNKVVFGIKYQF
ncbi:MULTISPECIES: TorF family putative porin [unclassified Acinetobacter]|uniref:TorF family putative porin n=1 Tax=unclassified Acinetobacter TaxID=196816 RepID=UPI002934B241|nr:MULTISPECIES: TorF family putative porin [unclassified Acinetobacter]WOE30689.1 TorF family putative porin [Acinetobacter sp. SAAs470]WOE38882.1 TorF family putative porin [Acinetobacter sp. SAAs474]